MQKHIVVKDYKSPYPDPIIFLEGESVKIRKEFKDDPDWENWIWCEASNNRKAWVPEQYLHIKKSKGTFIKDYNAMELTITVGEELIITEIVNGFMMAEKAEGRRGWITIKNLELSE